MVTWGRYDIIRGMKRKIVGVMMSLVAGLLMNMGMLAAPVMAKDCSGGTFLGFRAWYAGLKMDEECNILGPEEQDVKGNGLAVFVWIIVMNVVSSVMSLAGMVVLGMLIYGGFLQITSSGDPGAVAKGKKVMLNSIIGLIIVTVATVVANTIILILKG